MSGKQMKRKARSKKSGIQMKLGIVVGMVTLIYFISVVTMLYSLTGSVQRRMNESYQSLTDAYVSQLRLEFEEVEKYVNTLSIDFDLNMLALEDPSSDAYQLRLYQIRQKIFSYYFNYRILTGFYLYDARTGLITYVPDDKGHYADFVREYVGKEDLSNGWYQFSPRGETGITLARTYRVSESQWLFAFVNLSGIAEEFGIIAEESGLSWDIEDPKGRAFYGTGEIVDHSVKREDYDVITEALEYSTINLNFQLFVGSDVIWEQNKAYIGYFVLSLIVFSAFVIGAVFYMRRGMLKPLQLLLEGMERFAGGDDQVKLDGEAEAEPEMAYALESFNRMVDEIRENKFLIYETKLEKQKLLIQNMQSQINPHFFSNTTNLIYNLLEIGKIDTAEQCLMLLSSYYRYMTTIGDESTTLKQEMDFVGSYLEIMKLRFPNKLSCEITIEEALKELRIPPLLIQPLAENCIRHGFTDRRHAFWIGIRIYEQDGAAVIDVCDNGRGFPENYRGAFDQKTPMPVRETKDGDDNHVGMQNIYQRLMMQYGERASMLIDSTGQFTMVRIRIKLFLS